MGRNTRHGPSSNTPSMIYPEYIKYTCRAGLCRVQHNPAAYCRPADRLRGGRPELMAVELASNGVFYCGVTIHRQQFVITTSVVIQLQTTGRIKDGYKFC